MMTGAAARGYVATPFNERETEMSVIHEASGRRLPARRVLAMLVACASLLGPPAHAQLSVQAMQEEAEAQEAWLEEIYGQSILQQYYAENPHWTDEISWAVGRIRDGALADATEYLVTRGVTPIQLRLVAELYGVGSIFRYRQYFSRFSQFFSDQDLVESGFVSLRELDGLLNPDAYGLNAWNFDRHALILATSDTPEEAQGRIRDAIASNYFYVRLREPQGGGEDNNVNTNNNNNNN